MHMSTFVWAFLYGGYARVCSSVHIQNGICSTYEYDCACVFERVMECTYIQGHQLLGKGFLVAVLCAGGRPALKHVTLTAFVHEQAHLVLFLRENRFVGFDGGHGFLYL